MSKMAIMSMQRFITSKWMRRRQCEGVQDLAGCIITVRESLKKEERAVKLLKKACELGDEIGCKNYELIKNSYYIE